MSTDTALVVLSASVCPRWKRFLEGSGVLFLHAPCFFPVLRNQQPCGDDAGAAAEGLRGGASEGSAAVRGVAGLRCECRPTRSIKTSHN